MDPRESPRRLLSLTSHDITSIAARAAQLAGQNAARHGASKAAFGILAVLDQFGPSSQADLGRRLGMDRRTVSEEAAKLERDEFILRTSDPEDPRRNRLQITSSGTELLSRLDESFTAMQDELLAPLSASDRRELTRLLGLLRR